jgi:hypothetical protein
MVAKAVFPSMSQVKRGTIINVSSVVGKRGWANAGAYYAAKFGLTGFTQALRLREKAFGIRACVLYPGGIATHWGAWSEAQRAASEPEPPPISKALPPAQVASLHVWIAPAPPELVLGEAIVFQGVSHTTSYRACATRLRSKRGDMPPQRFRLNKAHMPRRHARCSEAPEHTTRHYRQGGVLLGKQMGALWKLSTRHIMLSFTATSTGASAIARKPRT